MTSETGEADFELLLQFLQQQRALDLTGYKRPSLMRRVQRRMQIVGVEDFPRYIDYLEVHPEEFAQLFNTILINVTSFFRDEASWEYLRREVIPKILASKSEHEHVRIWSVGCASGEETYSLAISFAEVMGADAFRHRVKVYGTDADEEALGQARLASYSAKDLEAVDPVLVGRYFDVHGGRFVFRPELRRSVMFGRHDIVQDAPISRLDLLVCRNTLMYFNSETQAKILQRFHFALNGDGQGNGHLFLGRAEMLLSHPNLFIPLNLKYRIFIKVPPPAPPGRARALAQARGNETPVDAGSEPMRNDRLHELAADEAPVARIVVDANGTLAIANQKARTLFTIHPRDVGRPLQDLEIAYRPLELRSAIEQAYAERRTVTQTGVERRFADGERQYFDVMVAPLFDERQQPLGVGITFLDVTRTSRLAAELQRSREEIQTANEELQSANEELETTNEELQSSNEELETTNEELQSTNEELETMNEELQSTNAELQTVNEELHQRSEDLNRVNGFLESVLAGMRGAAMVLDLNLVVMSWNRRAEDLWGLRVDEALGRSLLNLDIGLPVGELREAIRACVNGASDHQQALLDAVNRKGRKIQCRVTCTPLVSGKKREGVIVLMEEEAA